MLPDVLDHDQEEVACLAALDGHLELVVELLGANFFGHAAVVHQEPCFITRAGSGNQRSSQTPTMARSRQNWTHPLNQGSCFSIVAQPNALLGWPMRKQRERPTSPAAVAPG